MNKKVSILYGMSGTLKSTISNNYLGYSIMDSNNDYNECYTDLWKSIPKDPLIYVDSSALLANHYSNIKQALRYEDSILVGRGLLDYYFWNYHQVGLSMEVSPILELESKLFTGCEVNRILLINESDKLMDSIEKDDKSSRKFDRLNYKKLQNQYVDLIIDNYSNAKVMLINDDNIDEIIKEVSQLINYGK
jgi:hypothetical protein